MFCFVFLCCYLTTPLGMSAIGCADAAAVVPKGTDVPAVVDVDELVLDEEDVGDGLGD